MFYSILFAEITAEAVAVEIKVSKMVVQIVKVIRIIVVKEVTKIIGTKDSKIIGVKVIKKIEIKDIKIIGIREDTKTIETKDIKRIKLKDIQTTGATMALSKITKATKAADIKINNTPNKNNLIIKVTKPKDRVIKITSRKDTSSKITKPKTTRIKGTKGTKDTKDITKGKGVTKTSTMTDRIISIEEAAVGEDRTITEAVDIKNKRLILFRFMCEKYVIYLNFCGLLKAVS